MVSVQDPKPEDPTDTNLLIKVHLQLPNEECWQSKDRNIEDDVCHAADNIHDRIVCRCDAYDPVAPERPDLEECGEEEGDEPGDYDPHHDLDDYWEPSD